MSWDYHRNGLIIWHGNKGDKKYATLDSNFHISVFHEGFDRGKFDREINDFFSRIATNKIKNKLDNDMNIAYQKIKNIQISEDRTLFDIAAYLVSGGIYRGNNPIERQIMEGFISEKFMEFAPYVIASDWNDIDYREIKFDSLLNPICFEIMNEIQNTKHKIKPQGPLF